jgi:hypothetical protein
MSTQHLPDGSELLLRMVYSAREKQGVIVRFVLRNDIQETLTLRQALVVVSCISLVAIVTLLSVISVSRP